MIQVEAGDIIKIVTGCASLGGGFAFFKPFAAQVFTWYLERKKTEAEIADKKDLAIVRIAELHERTVGVLENMDQRFDRTDGRLNRIESHLGIQVNSIPSPPPPAPPPRQQLKSMSDDPHTPLPARAPG